MGDLGTTAIEIITWIPKRIVWVVSRVVDFAMEIPAIETTAIGILILLPVFPIILVGITRIFNGWANREI